jgi:hypothetical protein
MKGLIIGSPQIDKILAGKKTWEMRSTATKQRGLIALIRKGSGTVVGVAHLVDSMGPLEKKEMLDNEHRHQISPDRLDLPKICTYRHAWVLEKVRAFQLPINYSHPSGAVIWVNLDAQTAARIQESSRTGH